MSEVTYLLHIGRWMLSKCRQLIISPVNRIKYSVTKRKNITTYSVNWATFIPYKSIAHILFGLPYWAMFPFLRLFFRRFQTLYFDILQFLYAIKHVYLSFKEKKKDVGRLKTTSTFECTKVDHGPDNTNRMKMVCVRVTSLRAKNNLFIAKVGHITRETLDCFTSKTKFRLYFSLHSSTNATFRCYNIINVEHVVWLGNSVFTTFLRVSAADLSKCNV